MSGHLSENVLQLVETNLSSEIGLTPAEVHRRVGCWSLITMRHALRELVQTGRAVAEGADCRKLYRLAAG